jgi:hypothetical protein
MFRVRKRNSAPSRSSAMGAELGGEVEAWTRLERAVDVLARALIRQTSGLPMAIRVAGPPEHSPVTGAALFPGAGLV